MKSKNKLLAKKKQIKAKSAKAKHNRLLGIHNPNAAGADIGATQIYIAVPPDRLENNVRCFGTFTADLRALVQWLKDCAVSSVAMESTGVYWIPLYELLEQEGFEVYLVNARHVKNVPGRKSDVQDCQWLQYLHPLCRAGPRLERFSYGWPFRRLAGPLPRQCHHRRKSHPTLHTSKPPKNPSRFASSCH
jgi:Transposase